MAKAVATCTCKQCGEEFTKIKYNCYNRSDADSWEEWAADYFDLCPDCYKAQQAEKKRKEKEQELEKAKERYEALALPELAGDEEQIAKAEEIRLGAIEGLISAYADEYIESAKADGDEAYQKAYAETSPIMYSNSIISGTTKWVDFYTTHKNNGYASETAAALEYIFAVDSAKYWIDNRRYFGLYCFNKDDYKLFISKAHKALSPEPEVVKEPEEERTMRIKYSEYKEGVFSRHIERSIRDSYDSDDRTIAVIMNTKADIQYVLDYYEAQKEKRRLEREAEERRTVTIRYKDYKDGVFADRIKKQVYDSYDSRKRTIDVILKSDEDAEFVKAYYDKPKAKKKAERRQKRYDLQDGLIDEYTITPETIDADKLTVEVPEELRNGIDKATA